MIPQLFSFRKVFLTTIVTLNIIAPVLLVAQNKQTKPNIIFILTDDQRFDALGVMGNTIIQTPNMDKLANNGVLFHNAYVTTSICCVSRASLLTGQYESRHGIHDFKTNLSAQALEKTYPILLKNAGYKLGFIGKFGVGNKPPENKFDFFVNTEAGGLMQPTYITTDKYGNKVHDTDTIGHAIIEFLSEYGKAGKEPFSLSVSFKAPHEEDGDPPKYIIQPKYKDYYKDVTIPLAVTATEKYWNELPDFLRTEENLGRKRWLGLFGTDALYQENVKNYYRLITGVDEVVGDMMMKLKQLGIADNTVIMVMGDNGMFLGEHGMEGKWYGYEESVRVPLVIYNPNAGDKIKNYKAEQISLNIDIAPTMLALAGLPIPKGMQGIDLIGVIENRIPERKDFFYQHYYLGSPKIPKVEGVIEQQFKYMNYIEHGYEQLFDIKHDPHEIDNLAGNAKYKKELDALRKKYASYRKSTF
jgi:arylsulfatase A-like enzyme